MEVHYDGLLPVHFDVQCVDVVSYFSHVGVGAGIEPEELNSAISVPWMPYVIVSIGRKE